MSAADFGAVLARLVSTIVVGVSVEVFFAFWFILNTTAGLRIPKVKRQTFNQEACAKQLTGT